MHWDIYGNFIQVAESLTVVAMKLTVSEEGASPLPRPHPLTVAVDIHGDS